MKIREASRLTLALFTVVLACSTSAAILEVEPAGSRIEVAVAATGDDFVATLARFTTKVDIDSSGVPSGGEIAWDFADLKTGNKSRDKEMLHWLQYNQHPKAAFKILSCRPSESGAELGGELTIHGVTRSIVVPLKISSTENGLNYDGEVKIDHREYGLERIVKLLVLKVDPELRIRFHISGKAKG